MARPSRRLGNLPAETSSFIGRRRELAEVKKKLGQARLISLVGPGGVGKTRLAIEIASNLARGFRDGAWLAELAEVRDPKLVSTAVMAALDLRDQAGAEPVGILVSYLKGRHALLVIDNCEHLLDASARMISELLRAAPDVRVIATSREPLGVSGENVVPVAPLELPSHGGAERLEDLRQNEAVGLFVDRASEASGAFVLDASNRASVVDICRRLDGLPLAIELAAVRTRTLSLPQIRDRLDDRFSLLTGGSRAALPRHQTLRTTIDWSYELLSEAEREMLRRLCVFAGRFTLDDVEACASAHTDVADVLSSLIDKSLVIKEEVNAQACYRLHETMREYAAEKLEKAGEIETVGERCTEYFRSKALLYAPEARYHLPEWLPWADLEIDNLRAVLRHCLDRHDGRRGIELAMSLGWYWITRSTTEGIYWLDALLAHGPSDPVAQFWAYFQRGFLAVLKFDPIPAGPALAQAVAAAREIGQPELLSNALSMASIVSNMAGDSPSAGRLLDESAAVTAPLEDVQARISLLQARSMHGFFGGDIAAVRAAALAGIDLARAANDLYSLEMMLLNLGSTALFSGELDEARRCYVEALEIARRIDDRVAQYALLDSLGCQAAASGQPRLAAQLIGAGEMVMIQAGASLIPILAPMLGQAEASAVAAIGRAKYDAAVADGKGLSREDAIKLALGETTGDRQATAPPDGKLALLGKREADVAALIAEGLSNKQIGARLFISERTVDSHVRGILNKLGFNSRAQIAAWMSSER